MGSIKGLHHLDAKAGTDREEHRELGHGGHWCARCQLHRRGPAYLIVAVQLALELVVIGQVLRSALDCGKQADVLEGRRS